MIRVKQVLSFWLCLLGAMLELLIWIAQNTNKRIKDFERSLWRI